MLPWLLCAVLAAAALVLLVRLRVLQKSVDEMGRQLEERLGGDTNNPIFLPGRDPHARRLAAQLNVQLKQLRRLRQRYEGGDRALKEALTNVSHDLRTPLTAICGYLELLQRRGGDPDTARYLALISGRVDAMRQLTEELLRCCVAQAAQEEARPEPMDLNAAVEECTAAFYGALVERGIVPSVSMPRARVVRTLDRALLGRVLGNILNNAVKFSAGDLDIALREDGSLTFANAAPALDEVQVGRLFDRFFTVDSARGSTGLGLFIAKTLTEGMGGTIAARYDQGRLTVTLRFPPPRP